VVPRFVRDTPPIAALQRVVDDERKRRGGANEGGQKEAEEDPTERQRRPSGTVEDAVIGGEVTFIVAADGA